MMALESRDSCHENAIHFLCGFISSHSQHVAPLNADMGFINANVESHLYRVESHFNTHGHKHCPSS